MGLDIDKLVEINVKRTNEACIPLDDWTLSEWALGIGEEAGEVLGVCKKLRRMECGINFKKDPQSKEEYMKKLEGELADVVLYTCLVSAKANIDLSKAIVDKFNEVSDRLNTNIKL